MKKNNMKEKAIHIKIQLSKKMIYKKFIIYRLTFILLSILSIFISSSIVVLNLYSIRWNDFPKQTMAFFFAMSLIASISTFFISFQSFLNITNRKYILKENIAKNDEITSILKDKTELIQEEIDNIMELF
ncbi:hypothetical protein RRG37_00625 [Mycoplasmopsis felis]|uniref:hypothetical protein n=1 Tax=Mycoplasmopsis felis TaxID=33923 RepID=UPI002AFF4577|nr:hypothetical protein [Mycoplasmopsis felis]WQQ05892.1 hypothetical protein RRG40_02140 [Mycoplasmopsis felis]